MPVGRSTSPTHLIGSHAEDLACAYLQEQGLSMVAQNWYVAGVGELDLVMLDNSQRVPVLVFVEVRKRQSKNYGGAAQSITQNKRNKIIQTAQYFLSEHEQYVDTDCRFDVVAVERREIHWYPAAFLTDG